MQEVDRQNVRSFRPAEVQAVVLDWAGTTVDFGSRAPVVAILAAFEQAGFPITEQTARGPMGRAKRDHIQALLMAPEVAERWASAHGKRPEETDVDAIYEQFLVHQAECIAQHSSLIPDCLESVVWCRSRGLKIGSSTGYTRRLLERTAQQASEAGYAPDVMLSADDVSPGRPEPWLCLENARRLGVYPMSAVVKVDDAPAGITAGRNAGAWCVGVVVSGNEVGLAADEWEALPSGEGEQRHAAASERLIDAGAHLLIDTIAELPQAIECVNARLADGEQP